MRMRKIILAALMFCVLMCEITSVWILMTNSHNGLAPSLLHIVFGAYIFILATFSVLQNSPDWHSRSISHLSVLTLAATCVFVASLLIPNEVHLLSSVACVLYFLASAIALTTPSGPPLHYPMSNDLPSCEENVAGNANGSVASTWLFFFTTQVLALGSRPKFEISDLPVLKASMRATKTIPRCVGLQLGYNILHVNTPIILGVLSLSFIISFTYYAPPFFLQKLLEYLEVDTGRSDRSWGWVWVSGLFLAHFVLALVMAQLTFVSAVLTTRMRMQLNTPLFAKTLARKDVASSSSNDATGEGEPLEDSADYSKAGIIALMSSDVDQVGSLADGIYDIMDTPFEILILGAIWMLKFMAWERNFETRVLKIRDRELAYQKLSYTVEMLWTAMGDSVPIIFSLVSFWHFTVIREQVLTPSITFTALSIFIELQFSIKGIPKSIINLIQGYVSLRRIESYLNGAEVSVPPLKNQAKTVALQSATITWPQAPSGSRSVATTPHRNFMLLDLSLTFPPGELSLVCGKLGSGKSLLLLALLGEADILSGQVLCPRSPPDSLASVGKENPGPGQWIIDGLCAYVPQTAWLRNQSIKDNILFNLPYDHSRYQTTLQVCALVADLAILEDGDDSEIGERGVNLSGGQRARVSLARAVYSRASILLLDDVLSAVDAHTAHHIYHECLKGLFMAGRTVILVSHHVQLCVVGAAYVVALDNGRVQFQGHATAFRSSGIFSSLVQVVDLNTTTDVDAETHNTADLVANQIPVSQSVGEDTVDSGAKKTPPKFVEVEGRSVGNVGSAIWLTYMKAWGGYGYWTILVLILLGAACSPLLENGWLKIWSGLSNIQDMPRGPMFYISVYAALTLGGLGVKTLRWYILYSGSIQASRNLLHSILFANIRFHDTISRGRLLNRFGKDLEAIDKRMSTTIGHGVIAVISASITFIVIRAVGGLPFCLVAIVLGLIHYRYGKMYANASRDMRRLEDPTILSGTLRSTLYVFGEYTDAEIFDALRRVHLIPSPNDVDLPQDLITINANVFKDLDFKVSESGDKFSEKQLLCMARAILKHSKILVMDEATASVDYATDELINHTIRKAFTESTVLAIAHRLSSIISYDRVMLLDQGRIVEFERQVCRDIFVFGFTF
ncbi:P-loop containing nucleoside triphosphate hydrolase protein [Mycena vulgaris]|nr:P-loop containing nucleoside triphosphate hydrolase protein [Mycena vulgaris]